MAGFGSIGHVAAEGIGKIFGSRAALGYFAVYSATNLLTASAEAARTFGEGAYAKDPNTFQNSGYAAGEMIGSGLMLGADMTFLIHGWPRAGLQEAVKHGGNTYLKEKGGFSAIMQNGSKGSFISETEGIGPMIAKSKMKGVYSTEKGFLKNMGWKTGLGLGVGAFAASMIMPHALGFAGKFIDESYNERRRMEEINYDSRYFNTDRYDGSTYQQLGAAMNAYQNKMVSMARIFHSR